MAMTSRLACSTHQTQRLLSISKLMDLRLIKAGFGLDAKRMADTEIIKKGLYGYIPSYIARWSVTTECLYFVRKAILLM